MDAPDSRHDAWVLIHLQATLTGEYFYLIRGSRLSRDPILDPKEHARARSILPQSQKPGRQTGHVSVETLQAVPVSVIKRNLLIVGLDAKRGGLAPNPLEDVLVLGKLAKVDGVLLVEIVNIVISGGVAQVHQDQKQAAHAERGRAHSLFAVTKIQRRCQQSQNGHQDGTVIVPGPWLLVHDHAQ